MRQGVVAHINTLYLLQYLEVWGSNPGREENIYIFFLWSVRIASFVGRPIQDAWR